MTSKKRKLVGIREPKQLNGNKMRIVTFDENNNASHPHPGKSVVVVTTTKKSLKRRGGRNNEYLTCVFCDRKCGKEFELIHHMNMHTDERPYFCAKCDGTFKTRRYLKEHMGAVHASTCLGEFYCGVCGKFFRHPRSFRKHNSVFHNSRKKMYQCLICSRSFNLKYNLKSHLRAVHYIDITNEEEMVNWEERFVRVLQQAPISKDDGVISKGQGCGDDDDDLNGAKTVEARGRDGDAAKGPREVDHCDGQSLLVDELLCIPKRASNVVVAKTKKIGGREAKAKREVRNRDRDDAAKGPREVKNCEGQSLIDELLGVVSRRASNLVVTKTVKAKKQVGSECKINHSGKKVSNKTRTKLVYLSLKCVLCEKEFRTRYHLERHLLSHTGERPYFCTNCEATFKAPEKLRAHVRAVHDPSSTGFSCQVCGKSFQLQWSFLKHKVIHERKELYQCQVCMKSFFWKSDLYQHLRAIHKVDTTTKSTLQELVGVVNALDQSGRRRKKEIQDQKCEKKKKTTAKRKRRSHFQIPKKCIFCRKEFKKSWDFEQHLVTHTNEKPYFCGTCDAEFTRSSSLNCHILTQHSSPEGGNSPAFVCELCGKIFKQRSYLVKHDKKFHQLQPEEIKMFECAVCKERFHWQTEIFEHLLSTHKNN